MKSNDEINLFIEQFSKVFYVDFGINDVNDSIKNWYNLSWEEFRNELLKMQVKVNAALMRDWEYFFHHQKNKVLSLKQI